MLIRRWRVLVALRVGAVELSQATERALKFPDLEGVDAEALGARPVGVERAVDRVPQACQGRDLAP